MVVGWHDKTFPKTDMEQWEGQKAASERDQLGEEHDWYPTVGY